MQALSQDDNLGCHNWNLLPEILLRVLQKSGGDIDMIYNTLLQLNWKEKEGAMDVLVLQQQNAF